MVFLYWLKKRNNPHILREGCCDICVGCSWISPFLGWGWISPPICCGGAGLGVIRGFNNAQNAKPFSDAMRHISRSNIILSGTSGNVRVAPLQ